MKNNRRVNERQLELIQLYGYCQLGMTPKGFYEKWSLTHAQIALICDRSTTTVSLWFSRGRNYRRPTKGDLRHLALMDFLLEHFLDDHIAEFLSLLCPPKLNP